jgi:hypothetical protein
MVQRQPLATLATKLELPGIVVPTAPAFHAVRGTLPGSGSQAPTHAPTVEGDEIPAAAVSPRSTGAGLS